MDEVACRLVLFALKHRHAGHHWDQGHVLDDLPRDGPASFVVPRHPVAVQRRVILRRQRVGSHESPRPLLGRLRASSRRDTYRVQGDVEIGHGDQTRHGDVGGEPHDQNGLQAAAATLTASFEEGLLRVWMQK